MRYLIVLASLLFLSFSSEKASVLYSSIDPQSIAEHLAFYHLFPETEEGKKALEDAWRLMAGVPSGGKPLAYLPQDAVPSIVTLVTKAEGIETIALSPTDLEAIDEVAKRLPNRKLKGHTAESEAEVLTLAPEEVDLSRGLLLAQAADNPSLKDKIASYDALIDLMALQILTRIELTDPPEKKIRAINRFIFEEMKYRFPPHSIYAKDIDLYTYLPSVIDSRRGVCLGVSILYLALSQRLGLKLEAVTPPGHIFVRYSDKEKTINIETTARGIHLDSEEYLGIETTTLETKNIKEVIGLAYFNEASVRWQSQNYEQALKCYQKAIAYLPNDPLLQELMGYNYLFVGEIEKGRKLLQKVQEENSKEGPLMQETVIADFLSGKVDPEGIRTIFLFVDEKRESLLRKKEALEKIIANWPEFRAGYFSLAVSWLQLHRTKEALQVLEEYENREENDPSAEYLLTELYAIRANYPKAWEHLHKTEELLKEREEPPKTLKHLHRELAKIAPE